ncbi:hypothetical protein [Actinomadura miaoliensis]|uniref:DUF222 domain-containing protein n=1 Tax=Actinomadura miaoliensis TaxID=430685 RepID=A0ABP7WC35_9ACTN
MTITYVATKTGKRKHPTRPDGTVPCEINATIPAEGERADLPVCGTCTAILADEAAAFIAAEMEPAEEVSEEVSEEAAEEVSEEAAEEVSEEAAVPAAACDAMLRLRVGQRMLNFIAGRLDGERDAGLLTDIGAAEVRKAGAGANAYVTTTVEGARALLGAVEDLYADMQAKRVRTTQTGFRARVLAALATDIKTTIATAETA